MDDGNLAAKAMVKEQVWMEVCSAAFDTLLEGFCRVKKCSKEGRAAMGVDLSTLNAGLEGVHSSRAPHGKDYAEALAVKCSYMQDDEALRWIEENYQAYPYRCVLGIISHKMSSMMNPKKLRDAVAFIDSLYNLASDEEEGKLSALMSKMSSSTTSSGGLGLTSGLGAPTPSSPASGGMSALSASMSNISSSLSGSSEASGDNPEPSGSKFSLGNRMMRAARASIAGNIGNN
jgi:hypothetical protein